jgi:hypothetical protein
MEKTEFNVHDKVDSCRQLLAALKVYDQSHEPSTKEMVRHFLKAAVEDFRMGFSALRLAWLTCWYHFDHKRFLQKK